MYSRLTFIEQFLTEHLKIDYANGMQQNNLGEGRGPLSGPRHTDDSE